MKELGRLGVEAIQAVAFLIVIATLAPGAARLVGRPVKSPTKLVVVSDERAPGEVTDGRVPEAPVLAPPDEAAPEKTVRPPAQDEKLLALAKPVAPLAEKEDQNSPAQGARPPAPDGDPAPAVPKEAPRPRLAIGFDPAAAAPAAEEPKPPPAEKAKREVEPAKAVDDEAKLVNPRRIRVQAPRQAALTLPIHRPVDAAGLGGPKVIFRRGQAAGLPVPPPPKPGVMGVDTRPPAGVMGVDTRPPLAAQPPMNLDPHAVRQYWERDVEQFRALERAGYPVAHLEMTFRARYRAVRFGAHADKPLSLVPDPPRPYLDALTDELKDPKP